MTESTNDLRPGELRAQSFYHLTRTKSLRGFVATTDPRGRKGKYHVPLECNVHGPEAPDARLCVAPSVWQCLVSMTDSKTLYIYSLACVGAFPPAAEDKVLDAGITGEHWITDTVIEQNGGLIPVRQIGLISSEQLWATRDRLTRWQLKLGSEARALDERSHLWQIDETRKPNEWRLRDGVGVLDESEMSDDVTPLGLPQWDWSQSFDQET
jgi:hypothetical protein